MKTLEEAIKTFESSSLEEAKNTVAKYHSIIEEAARSSVVRMDLTMLISALLSHRDDGEDGTEAELSQLLKDIALSAFVRGMLVGIIMERQEL